MATDEIRNHRRTQTDIQCLRNVFGDYTTEKKNGNLSYFQFSHLCQYNGPEAFRGLQNEHAVSVLSQTRNAMTPYVIKLSKPQAPSSRPAWALKAAASELVQHLSFIINQSIKELSFPKSLRKAIAIPLFKKGDTEDPDND